MLIPVTVTVATPPSVAVIVRVTERPAVLRSRWTGAGHGRVNGAPLVEQLNRTVTGVRYQPDELFGRREVTVAVIRGSRRAVESDDPVKSMSPLYTAATS